MEDVELINEVKTEDSIKEERKWCVYCHTNKTNGKVYIGITCQKPQERWGKDGKGYVESPRFWNAIQKYGWNNFDHDIVFEDFTLDEANEAETIMIQWFDSMNPDYGYNLTGGGDAQYLMSDEVKEKISKSLKGKMVGDKNPNYGNHKLAGKNNPWFGKHWSDEDKERLRQLHIDKKASEETKRKLSQMRSNGKSPKIHPVYCIEMNRIFYSAQEATNIYGFNRCCIGDCCRKIQKSAGKHPETGEKLHWLYTEDAIKEGYITQCDVDNYLQEIRNKGDNDNEN